MDVIDTTAAIALGTEDGKAAASWYTVDDDNAASILRGIEDGDPEMLDTFPVHNSVDAALTERLGVEASDVELDVLLSAYENAHDQAVTDEIERRARYYSN